MKTDCHYWAYAVGLKNKVVIVRCETLQGAVEEHDRMKSSAAVKVGHTTRKVSEGDMRSECRKAGWKLEVIR